MSILGKSHDGARRANRGLTVKYFSTRGAGPVSLDDALRKGIASDGGLFLPERLPSLTVSDFDNADTIPDVAARLLAPSHGMAL